MKKNHQTHHHTKCGTHGVLLFMLALLMSLMPKQAHAALDLTKVMTLEGVSATDITSGYNPWVESDADGYMPGLKTANVSEKIASSVIWLDLTSSDDFVFSFDYDMSCNNNDCLELTIDEQCLFVKYKSGTGNYSLPIRAGRHQLKIVFDRSYETDHADPHAYLYNMKATTTMEPLTQKRATAVYDDATNTMTFYYDTTLRPFDGSPIFAINPEQGSNATSWHHNYIVKHNVKTIVFDDSFASFKPYSLYDWFYDFENLTELRGMANLNTSETSNFVYTFYGCKSLKTIDLSMFDTSNALTFHSMFAYCKSLETLDLTSFDTRKASVMLSLFKECSALKEIDLSTFDTSESSDLRQMFSGCANLEKIYATDAFVIPNGAATTSMFADCTNLHGAIAYDPNVTDGTNANYATGYFLKGCTHKNADGSSALGSPIHHDATCMTSAYTIYTCSLCQHTKQVTTSGPVAANHDVVKHEATEPTCGTDGHPTYYECSLCHKMWRNATLTTPLADFSEIAIQKTGHVLDAMGSCSECKQHIITLNGVTAQFVNIAQTNWAILNDEEQGQHGLTLTGKGGATTLAMTLTSNEDIEFSYNFSSDDVSMVVVVNGTYNNASSSGVLRMKAGCNKLAFVAYELSADTPINLFNLSAKAVASSASGKAVYDRQSHTLTFYADGSVPAEADDVYDVPEMVDNFNYWFNGYSQVEKVIFDKSYKTLKPKSTALWFMSFTNLKDIEGLENLDVSETVNMASMFAMCRSLRKLDLSSFNTAKVTNMDYMFADSGLRTIYVGPGFTIDNVRSGERMFYDCINLIGAMSYDSKCIDYLYANTEIGYFTEKCWHKDEAGQSLLENCTPVAATCKKAAHNVYECSKCHEQVEADFTGEPDLSKHDLRAVVPTSTPSCTEQGDVLYYECYVCWHLFTDEDATTELADYSQTKLAPLGHDFDDSYTCRRCNVTDPRYKALNTTGVTAIITDTDDNPWVLADESNPSQGLASAIIPWGQSIYTTMTINLYSDKPFRLNSAYKGDIGDGYFALVNDEESVFSYYESFDNADFNTIMPAGHHTLKLQHYHSVASESSRVWLTKFEATTELTEDELRPYPVAIYDEAEQTLTFKAIQASYVPKRVEHIYMVDIDNPFASKPEWRNETVSYMTIYVNIDESFSQFRPKSVANWFSNIINAKTIEGLQYLNTSETLNFSGLFQSAFSLKQPDLSHMDTGNGRLFDNMFAACIALETLDLTSFDMSKAESVAHMFDQCFNVERIYVSKTFNVDAVRDAEGNSEGMFHDCVFVNGGRTYDAHLTDASLANYRDGYLSTYYKVGSDIFPLAGDMTVDNLQLVDGKPFMTHDVFTARQATLARTLADDNVANIGTLCLPYAIKASGDYNIYVLNNVAQPSSALAQHTATDATQRATLYLTKVVDELPAGTPAIFKASGKNVEFATADVQVVEQPIDDETLSAQGIMLHGAFSTFVATPDNYVYNDNMFVRVSTLTDNSEGLRQSPFTACLIALPEQAVETDCFNLKSDDDVITAIATIENIAKGKAQVYDINGMKLQQLQKGINILRYADGTTQKVVVK